MISRRTLPSPGHLVLPQQVAQLGDQGREQRVGLGTEIAADQERLLDLPQVVAGRLGDGVDPTLGEVGPRPADLLQPQVARQEVGDCEPHDPAPAAVGAGVGGGPLRRATPAQPFQPIDVEGQEDAHDAEVEVQVTQVDDPAGDGLEARPAAHQMEQLRPPVPQKAGDGPRPDEIEGPADQGRADQADDGVVGAGGDEDTDGHIGCGQQQGRQVAPGHRTPIQGPEQRHGHRQGQGQGQGHGDQSQGRDEFAEHQLERGDRQGQQGLQGPGATLLAP